MRSIYEERGVRNVIEIMKQYKLHILVIQETKIKHTEITNMNGHTFFNSGGTNRY